MNFKGNPILIEMADQLPESSKAFQLIMTSVDYPIIIDQVKEDFYCFADLENERKNGMKGLDSLRQNGYEKFLKDMEGKFQENANEAKKLLSDTFNGNVQYKKAFVFEAATGRYKFGNAVQQAKYMLCWKPDNRGVQDFVVHSYPVLNINAKIITKYTDQIALDINWKSSSTANHLGYSAYQNLRLGLRDTVQNSKELQTEHYNAIQEYSYQLNEGFITEGAFWDKVKELSQKFVDKAKQLWGKFLGFIKKIVIAIKRAGADGLKALSNSLGFEMTANNTLINRDISIRI